MQYQLQTIQWLAEQVGMRIDTAYKLAESGRLAEFGVFKLGGRWRVSVPAFRRACQLDLAVPEAA